MKERLSLLLGLPLVLAGCGETAPSEPSWTELARGFRARSVAKTVQGWADGESRFRPDEGGPGGDGVWVERPLAPEVWTAREPAGLWSAPRPADGAFLLAQGPVRLAAGERTFVRALEEDEPEVGKFVLTPDEILLFTGEDVPVPDDVVFGIQVRNGLAVDGLWRVRVGDHVGSGVPVWTGGTEELYLEIPRLAELSFLTYFSPTLPERAEAMPRATFTLELDGRKLWSHEQGAGLDANRVALPEGGVEQARLALRVEGAPGLGVFYDAVVGPVEHGTYGTRPWGEGRPDLVLFLADTFRADNLATYGGEPGVAPNLDALAEESLRFTSARSPAAWTLPALGTLFSGYAPGQHGATDIGLALPRELETVTELLARRGYRTGAITDSGFFTIAFGLDQGFAWFEENQNTAWDLDHTIDEAVRFLERDDGRPIFLVVHTYRTHAPFRRGPEEDVSEWDRLMEDAFAMLEERREEVEPGEKGDLKREVLLTFQARLEELYRAGVRDLDAGFGRLLEELRARDVLEDGFLIFTSDHGEALGENDDVLHGGRLWEVKLRIPLLIHGGGLAPGDVDWAVSLSDIAPTLLDLAGLRPPAPWSGTPLLRLDEERPHFAYRLEENHRELAVIDRARKLLTRPDVERLRAGDVDAAYDLTRDPGETQNLSTQDWAAELAKRVWGKVADALTPATDAARVHTSPEVMKGLGEIGYGANE